MNPSDLNKVAARLPLSKSTLARNYPLKHNKDCHLGINWMECPACRANEDLPSSVTCQPGGTTIPGETSLATAAKRVRQSGKKLNKTEAAWLVELRRRFPDDWIQDQAITLRLANGVRYTPDAVRVTCFNSGVWFYEVKGFMRDDAAVKLKVAKSLYPWATWRLVWKDHGQWKEQTILP